MEFFLNKKMKVILSQKILDIWVNKPTPVGAMRKRCHYNKRQIIMESLKDIGAIRNLPFLYTKSKH